MDKERVIVEAMEGEKVAVFAYYNNIVSTPIEVCHKTTAMKNYNVVGELTDDGIELYSKEDNEDEDYSEFALVDDEDDD